MRPFARLVAASALALLACRSEPKVVQVEFAVEGMVCESCVEGISYEVGRLEGVESVVVELDTEKATVRYVEGEIEAAAIEAVIDNMGYEATISASPADAKG